MKLTAENLKDEVATLQLPSDLMELYNDGVRDMLEFYGEDKELTEKVEKPTVEKMRVLLQIEIEDDKVEDVLKVINNNSLYNIINNS